MDFIDLATHCAPNVAPQTMAAIVSVESSHNPYAIGVVGGRLVRQPTTAAEAIATAKALERQGKNFSMGIAQVNRHNLPRYNITYDQVFDTCTNLRVGGLILADCYARAMPLKGDPQDALRAALSCYYSGNFTRGFRPDRGERISYVQKVVAASGAPIPQQVTVPAIATSSMPALRAAEQARREEESNSVLIADEEPAGAPTVELAQPALTKDATDAALTSADAGAPAEDAPTKRPAPSSLVF